MKTFFYIHLFIWMAVQVSLILSIKTGYSFGLNNFMLVILYSNMVFGPFQFLSALVIAFWKRYRNKVISLYFVLSLIILTFIFLTPYVGLDFFEFFMVFAYILSIMFLYLLFELSRIEAK